MSRDVVHKALSVMAMVKLVSKNLSLKEVEKEAECGESRTLGFQREGRGLIASLDSTKLR